MSRSNDPCECKGHGRFFQNYTCRPCLDRAADRAIADARARGER